MTDLKLEPARTALLCLDLHNVIFRRVPPEKAQELAPTVRRVQEGARRTGIQVIHVEVARRRDFMSPRNKFSGATGFVTNPADIAEAMAWVDGVAPIDGEPVVKKPRISAFYGTELESMLHARDIHTLVITGVATNYVVESSARYAADADFRVIVLEDACGAFSNEAHTASIRTLNDLMEVATSEDFLASLP